PVPTALRLRHDDRVDERRAIAAQHHVAAVPDSELGHVRKLAGPAGVGDVGGEGERSGRPGGCDGGVGGADVLGSSRSSGRPENLNRTKLKRLNQTTSISPCPISSPYRIPQMSWNDPGSWVRGEGEARLLGRLATSLLANLSFIPSAKAY
ncbi:hypothetical protein BDK51DRAFT_28935, partial [Blyttiomyces helicus]